MKKCFAVVILSCLITHQSLANTFMTLTRQATPTEKLPTNITVIEEEEIKKTGAVHLGDFLDQHPAIDITRAGSLGSSTSIRIRGVPSSNQVQVVIDDQPVGGVSVQFINLTLIPVENIEKIEIVRGGSAGLYGPNVIGGVVHIITKKHKKDQVRHTIQLETRSHQTSILRAQAGARDDLMDVFVTGTYFDTGGYQDNSDGFGRNLTANIGTSFGTGGRLEFQHEGIQQKIGNPSGTTLPFNQWDGNAERQNINTATQQSDFELRRSRVKASLPFENGILFQSVGFRSDEDLEIRPSPSATPFVVSNNIVTGNDTRVSFPFGLVLGGSYERDERFSLGQIPRHITDWGLYAQAELTVSRLSLLPAIRFDQHSTFGNEYNPRLSVVYALKDNWKLSGNVARSVRAPTLVDLFIVSQTPDFPQFDFFGNPNLRPEVAWTYDLGTQVDLSSNARFDVTGYFTRIRERHTNVDTDNNGNVDTIRNASLAELGGVEVAFNVKSGAFQHRFNYTYQRAKGNSGSSAEFVNLRLTPPHLANYDMTWSICPGLQAVNTFQYVSRQFQFDNDRGLKIPFFFLWNARIEKTLPRFNVFFAVHNITDELYAESITFGNLVPQPTRTYRAGITIKIPPSKKD